MFEQLGRMRPKVRFQSGSNLLAGEDLWDLNVTVLDQMYKYYNKQLKETDEDSLLSVRSKADDELALKVEIIKHIVAIKQSEALEKSLKKAELENNARRKEWAIEAQMEDEKAKIKAMTPEERAKFLATL